MTSCSSRWPTKPSIRCLSVLRHRHRPSNGSGVLGCVGEWVGVCECVSVRVCVRVCVCVCMGESGEGEESEEC